MNANLILPRCNLPYILDFKNLNCGISLRPACLIFVSNIRSKNVYHKYLMWRWNIYFCFSHICNSLESLWFIYTYSGIFWIRSMYICFSTVAWFLNVFRPLLFNINAGYLKQIYATKTRDNILYKDLGFYNWARDQKIVH